jgi:mono/diheme cytochrome c family protein
VILFCAPFLAGAVPLLAAPPAADTQLFAAQVKPILQKNCLSCHGGESPQGGLRLTSRDALLKGGASGPAVLAGKPEESLLIAAVNHRGRKMPPTGKLSRVEIEALTRWVAQGAPWPSGDAGDLEAKAHAGPPKVTPEAMRFWSFRPVARPAVPKVKRQGWVRNPVDAFILKRLEASGLAPNPQASRAALIRRATYDLTGLPPTPEAVQAFLADRSPNAWEKVVDRLLASPHYGEKWGRHWLDLVRYAESNSYERDGTKPNAWRYRDYVIRAFNADTPYDRFIREQLAGDEIAPRTNDGLIATGFYRLGIWDDEPVDAAQALYDDLDDIATTTSQVFLGLTINCARCHDHKLDPIPQKDYYRFLAFFSGVHRYGGPGRGGNVERYSLRSIAPAAEQERHRVEAAAHRAKLQATEGPIREVERKVRPDLSNVEREEFQHEERRPDLIKKRVPALLTQEEFDRYVALRAERKSLRENPPRALEMALCVTEIGRTTRETHVLLRGNPHVQGEKVAPGFPSVLAPPSPLIHEPPQGETSGRRLALARWIAGGRNPLTSRVMANRIWQHHFGRGIVRSSSNFGFHGDKPTHPELLDWLASELVAKGWRLKAIHRLLMTSATYRMSSQGNVKALRKDPENDLFWRVDMRRLQAEEIRDSILAVNGSLNPKMGGPSIYPTLSAEVLAGQSVPGQNWQTSPAEEQRRRSVYIFVKRSLVPPILAGFDAADTDFSCPVRFSTTQPTQALGMLNSDFVDEQANVFAAMLRKRVGPSVANQVRIGLWRTLQRPPTTREVERGVRLIESLQRRESLSAEKALAAFCVVAYNMNEFMYLD